MCLGSVVDGMRTVLRWRRCQHSPYFNHRYLSERPWIIAITPSGSTSHLTILTPAFELSRSKRLPFALTADEWDNISWVVWQEAEDPYRVLLEHLDGLRRIDGQHEGAHWRVHLEENVREFVSAGLGETKVSQGLEVGFASLEVREQRMRKTQAEFLLQRCVAKITLEALRAVRKHLYIGMTEKEGEAVYTIRLPHTSSCDQLTRYALRS